MSHVRGLGQACPRTESAFDRNGVVPASELGERDGTALPAGRAPPCPQIGVVTYHPQGAGSEPSHLETCTLPDGEHARGTTVLDAFVLADGSR